MDALNNQLSTTQVDDQDEKGCQRCCGDDECTHDPSGDCSEKCQCECDKPEECPTSDGGCCSDCTCHSHSQKPQKGDRRWSDNMWRLLPGPFLEYYVLKDNESRSRGYQLRRTRSHSPGGASNHRSYRDRAFNCQSRSRRMSQPICATEHLQGPKNNSLDKLLDSLHLSNAIPPPPEHPVEIPVYMFNFSWRERRTPGETLRWNRFRSSDPKPKVIQASEAPSEDGNNEPMEGEIGPWSTIIGTTANFMVRRRPTSRSRSSCSL